MDWLEHGFEVLGPLRRKVLLHQILVLFVEHLMFHRVVFHLLFQLLDLSLELLNLQVAHLSVVFQGFVFFSQQSYRVF